MSTKSDHFVPFAPPFVELSHSYEYLNMSRKGPKNELKKDQYGTINETKMDKNEPNLTIFAR